MMFSSLVIFIRGINRYDFFTLGRIGNEVEDRGGVREKMEEE